MIFPGIAAVPPVAGAAAMIWADLLGRIAIGRLLSTRPMVWIGSLSYALYLRHWPIFVYARLVYHEDLPIVATLALIALAITTGWFSTQILEDRVQKAFASRQAWHLLLPTLATAVVIGSAAGAIYVSGGWPSRRPAAEWRAASRDSWRNQDATSCFVRTLNGKEARTTADIVAGRLCPLGKSGTQLDYLLWGDSHAEAMRAAYDGAGRRLGLSGAFVGEGGCPPLPAIDDRSRGADYDCLSTNRAVLALIQAKRVPLIILHARWVGMYTRSFFVRAPDGTEIHGDDPLRMTSALVAAIEALRAKGRRVVVMGAMPEPGYDVPAALVAPTCCRTAPPALHMRAAGRNKAELINREVLGPAMRAHGIPFVDPFAIYCPSGNCPVNSGRVPLYYDYRHVSAPGAKLFTAAAEQLMSAGLARR